MDNTEYIIKIAEQIEQVLHNGFVLSEDNLHFIYSYFAISTADELKIQLDDESFDSDMLFELVISPDEAFQVKVENIIETGQFLKSDEVKIFNQVLSTTSETVIIFPGNTDSVTIPVSKGIMDRFVSKLRIDNHIPAVLLNTIDMNLSEDMKNITRIKLRHSNLVFNNRTVHFLSKLIEKTSLLKNDYLPCLELSLSFVESSKSKEEFVELFQGKKAFYTQSRNNIQQIEELLKSSTMETIMLQGISVPSVSIEEIEQKIILADKILYFVFGHKGRLENTMEVNLGDYSGDEDIQKIFRLLS